MSFPKPLKSVGGFLLVACVFSLAYGQAPLYYSNQNQYFLHGLAQAGVGHLHEDWLANTVDPTPVLICDEHTSRTDSYDEFKSIREGRPGFVISPWCGEAKCEADIKTETQATIRNIPKGYETAPGKPCIRCGNPATVSAWFAKAY